MLPWVSTQDVTGVAVDRDSVVTCETYPSTSSPWRVAVRPADVHVLPASLIDSPTGAVNSPRQAPSEAGSA